MKKLISLAMLLLACFCVLVACNNGTENNEENSSDIITTESTQKPSEELEFSLTPDENGYEVTGIGSCTDTDIVIPSTYNGKPVTSIGDGAFGGCESLEVITVDDGNTVYHDDGNCIIETAIKTLVLGCKNSVIPTDGSVTSIGNEAFLGCSELESISLPDSVSSIGKGAFANCEKLAEITLSDNITFIGDQAFLYCAFTSFTIPKGVTKIDYATFSGCMLLESIYIPASVTVIGEYVFYYSGSLKDINYGGTRAEWESATKANTWIDRFQLYTQTSIHCTDDE